MASSTAKALVLLQIAVLLHSFLGVHATEWELYSLAASPKPHEHHHHHPHHHSHPPVYAPLHAPVQSPSHPPTKPPSSHPFERRLIAVQGVVYCKSCKYSGIDTLWGATPLVGSTVKLECNNTKYRPVVQTATTDKNGYFFLTPKGVTTAAFHKCKVFLVSSPSATCDIPTNFNYGVAGAILKPAVTSPYNPLFGLFTVGPLAYEPSKRFPCPR